MAVMIGFGTVYEMDGRPASPDNVAVAVIDNTVTFGPIGWTTVTHGVVVEWEGEPKIGMDAGQALIMLNHMKKIREKES